jgi:hypothetical protein
MLVEKIYCVTHFLLASGTCEVAVESLDLIQRSKSPLGGNDSTIATHDILLDGYYNLYYFFGTNRGIIHIILLFIKNNKGYFWKDTSIYNSYDMFKKRI